MKTKNKLVKLQEKLALTETGLALERTIMSKESLVLNEMTVLLGIMALGFALIKFFENNGLVFFAGSFFVGVALIGILLSMIHYQQYKEKLKKVEEKTKVRLD